MFWADAMASPAISAAVLKNICFLMRTVPLITLFPADRALPAYLGNRHVGDAVPITLQLMQVPIAIELVRCRTHWFLRCVFATPLMRAHRRRPTGELNGVQSLS